MSYKTYLTVEEHIWTARKFEGGVHGLLSMFAGSACCV